MESLSFVIVTYCGGELVGRCVESIVEQMAPPDRLVVVVSGVDAPVDFSELEEVEVLRLGRDAGFAEGANAGIEQVKKGAVIVLNDDTRALPGFVEAMREFADQPGLYAPRILLSDGSNRIDNTGHGLFPDGFNWARGREDQDAASYDEPRDVGACSGAAVMIHREVLDALGGFDTDLEAFGEDVDLSLRARRLGFRSRYVPRARVEHVLGASYGRFGPRKLYLVERNRIRVAVRSLPATAVLTMPVWTGARMAMLGMAAVLGRGWVARVPAKSRLAAVVGLASGLIHIPGALAKRRLDSEDWVLGERGMWGHLLSNRVRVRDVMR